MSCAMPLPSTNHGPGDAHNVFVLDEPPAGATFFFEDRPGGGRSCQLLGEAARCPLFDIPEGETAETALVYLAPGAGTATNRATVSADEDDRDPANNTDTADTEILPQSARSADVSLTKSDGVDSARVGETLTYTLIASNAGPHQATGVRITDALPPHLTFVSVSPAAAQCGVVDNVISCNLGSIAAGADFFLPITIVVRANGVQ